jgi:WD40 repeat protein
VAGTDWKDRQVANVFDTASGERTATIRTRGASIFGLSLNQSGDRVTVSGWSGVPVRVGAPEAGRGQPQDSEVKTELFVAAVPSGEELFRPSLPASHIVGSPALSADGRRLACAVRAVTLAGQVMTPAPKVAIYVWEVAGGPPRIMDGQFDGSVTCVAFNPAGTQVAAASIDGTLRLWDATTCRPVFTPAHESQPLTGIAFSPDGRRLAGAAMDGLVRLWDATDGERLLTLRGLGRAGTGHYGFTARVALSPDGTRLAANDWDGTVTIWDAAPADSPRAPE